MKLGGREAIVCKVVDDLLNFSDIRKNIGFDIEEGFKKSSFNIYLSSLSFDSGVRFFRGNLVPIYEGSEDSVKELLSNVEVSTFLTLEDLEKEISSINISEGTQIFIFRESGKYLLYTKTLEEDTECYQGVSEEVAALLKS